MRQIRAEITEFRSLLGEWFIRHGRRLPWRSTTDPYRILVSELMLQQTQVNTVIGFYQRWLQRFPTLRELAEADEAEVLAMWEGLGYYHRARNLWRCAQALLTRSSGSFPESVDELRSLPGIGRYTAGAIVSFAFDRPAPILDANVTRVLARLVNLREPVNQRSSQLILWKWAEDLVQGSSPRLLNSALMELGAVLCKPRKPLCVLCPVRAFCRASDPESIPRKPERPARVQLIENYRFIRRNDRVQLQRSESARWRGLWHLPRLALAPAGVEPLLEINHPFTRYLIKLRVFAWEDSALAAPTPGDWHRETELSRLPIATPHRRALQVLLSGNA